MPHIDADFIIQGGVWSVHAAILYINSLPFIFICFFTRYSWAYVSNAEVRSNGGGVGSIIFDANGEAINYEMILTG